MPFVFPLIYISAISFGLYWILIKFPMISDRINVDIKKNKIKRQNKLLSEIKEFEDEYDTSNKNKRIYNFIKGEN